LPLLRGIEMSFTGQPLPWFCGAARLVAQPDRAPDFESGGWGFESLRDGHVLTLAEGRLFQRYVIALTRDHEFRPVAAADAA
jgi:hypothetical protein